MAAIVTDILIILMLAGGIAYAFVVNRRVKRLMGLLRELEPAVQQFSLAVDKSEASVAQMQQSLTKGIADAEQAEADRAATEEVRFSSRRETTARDVGVRVIRDKQDMVRRFFDVSRREGRA